MSEIKKFGAVRKQEAGPADLAKINEQTLRELAGPDVFVFRVAACDDQVDRDHERFTEACLRELAPLYVGRTVLMDHKWSAGNQVARVYDAAVETGGDGVHRLVLRAYMLRNEATAPVVAAIEGGILREVSVGCAVGKAVCGICGADKSKTFCKHRPGEEYDGKTCVVELSEARDAYEVSLVAVPAQPGAGVVKTYGGENNPPPEAEPEKDPAEDPEVKKALALLELAALEH